MGARPRSGRRVQRRTFFTSVLLSNSRWPHLPSAASASLSIIFAFSRNWALLMGAGAAAEVVERFLEGFCLAIILAAAGPPPRVSAAPPPPLVAFLGAAVVV